MTQTMRAKTIVAFLVAALPVLAGPKNVPFKSLTDDEIAIYELLLSKYPGELIVSPSLFAYEPDKPELLWKRLGTSVPNIYQTIPLLKHHREAFDDMQAKARLKQNIRQWNPRIRVGVPAKPELDTRDPITVFSFSAIGFDRDHRVALVIRSGQQGPLAGSGECMILRKATSGWEIETELTLWIS